jgi:phage-related protein
MIRELIFWGDNFDSFYSQLDNKVQRKVDYVLWLIQNTEKVPVRFLKSLEDTDDLYEVKVSTSFKEIRILCFFDEGKLIVLVNCFFKKSRKTPRQEIEVGERLKKEYFEAKRRRKHK